MFEKWRSARKLEREVNQSVWRENQRLRLMIKALVDAGCGCGCCASAEWLATSVLSGKALPVAKTENCR